MSTEQKQVLVLLANDYPANLGDTSFIQHEINQVTNEFDRVVIFSFEPVLGEMVTLPANAHYAGALRSLPRYKSLLALFKPKYIARGLRSIINETKWRPSPRYISLSLGNIVTGIRFASQIEAELNSHGLESQDQVTTYSFWASNGGMALPFLPDSFRKFFRLHRFDLYEIDRAHLPLRASLFSTAHRILPISDHGRKYLLEKYPKLIERRNLQVLRLGTADHGTATPRAAHEEPSKLHVVSCSSVIPVKRVDSILPALELLASKYPVKWTHFGDGTQMEELKSSTKNMERNNPKLEIDLRGQSENRDVLDHYKNEPVDVFVNVSDSEGVPVSIMEALSFDIPVVATDAGGTSELVGRDKLTGTILPLRPPKEILAEAIDEVFTNRDRLSPRLLWQQLCDAKANGDLIAEELRPNEN